MGIFALGRGDLNLGGLQAMSPSTYFNYPWDLKSRLPYMELPFPMSEYQRRLTLLRSAMEREDVDCLLIPGDVRERGNVRWLTNFYPLLGDTIVVFAREGNPIIVTTAAVHGEPMHSYIYDTWVPDIRPALGSMLPPDPPLLTART